MAHTPVSPIRIAELRGQWLSPTAPVLSQIIASPRPASGSSDTSIKENTSAERLENNREQRLRRRPKNSIRTFCLRTEFVEIHPPPRRAGIGETCRGGTHCRRYHAKSCGKTYHARYRPLVSALSRMRRARRGSGKCAPGNEASHERPTERTGLSTAHWRRKSPTAGAVEGTAPPRPEGCGQGRAIIGEQHRDANVCFGPQMSSAWN